MANSLMDELDFPDEAARDFTGRNVCLHQGQSDASQMKAGAENRARNFSAVAERC